MCVCVWFALGRDLLQLGPKIDGENLSLSTPCLRHWTNWTFINRANKQGWLSKHKHTYVRKTERERERELERQSAVATKSFLLVIFFFLLVFGFAQLSDNLKLIGFHVWQDVQDLSRFVSLFLSVFCLEGAAQSIGRKGKRAANWSAFRASQNFLHILCAVFHAK